MCIYDVCIEHFLTSLCMYKHRGSLLYILVLFLSISSCVGIIVVYGTASWDFIVGQRRKLFCRHRCRRIEVENVQKINVNKIYGEQKKQRKKIHEFCLHHCNDNDICYVFLRVIFIAFNLLLHGWLSNLYTFTPFSICTYTVYYKGDARAINNTNIANKYID